MGREVGKRVLSEVEAYGRRARPIHVCEEDGQGRFEAFEG